MLLNPWGKRCSKVRRLGLLRIISFMTVCFSFLLLPFEVYFSYLISGNIAIDTSVEYYCPTIKEVACGEYTTVTVGRKVSSGLSPQPLQATLDLLSVSLLYRYNTSLVTGTAKMVARASNDEHLSKVL